MPSIYDVPLSYHAGGPRRRRCSPPSASRARRLRTWRAGRPSRSRVANPEGEVTIAVVGKYTGLKDAYKSLIEALHHGGIANRVKVNLDWIESETFEREDPAPFLEGIHGILVPGGFGQRGAEGKIQAARLRPGAQDPVFRDLLRHADGGDRGDPEPRRRHGRELDRVRPDAGAGGRPSDRMAARQRARDARCRRRSRRHHAARRLPGQARARQPRCREIYGGTDISERHRHRYEVNMAYRERLEEKGLRFSGISPDGAAARDRRVCRTIPGSSASSSIRS